MKKIPKFKNEEAERKFWSEHDSTEYVDWSKAKRAVFPKPEAINQDYLSSSSPDNVGGAQAVGQ